MGDGFVAPDAQSIIDDVMRDHPEINTRDEESPEGRARILDYAIARLNKEHREDPIPGAAADDPWGRKARRRLDESDPSTGVNLNTDGLTLLLEDGRFEIIDVIDGGSGKSSWHNYGAFDQGANGYWAPGKPVDDERPKPGPVPRPKPDPEQPAPAPKPAPNPLDYGQQLGLAREIATVLGNGRYKGSYAGIGEVIGHLLWKVCEEGYPVQAAIDNANRRARGEEAD